HRVGEDVSRDPRIGVADRDVAADRMQQEQPATGRLVVAQAAPGDVHVLAVVPGAYVLEHADGKYPVEAAVLADAVEFAIVLQADLDRQPCAKLAGIGGLLARDGDTNARHAMALGRELQGLAPTATDVEHAHAWPQPELAADEVELGFLRRVQVAGVAPVAAAVHHALAEHRLE